MIVRGRRVLVVGLGLQGGGLALVKWLVRRGVQVTVTDLKTGKQLESSVRQLRRFPVKLVLGRHPLTLLAGQDWIVQNPAVPDSSPLIQRAVSLGIPIENEASLFFKFCPSSIIGVTGSKGKSTTTAWLGAMLKNHDRRTVVAGNIRDRVMFDALASIRPGVPVVLELSSWHLDGLARWRLSPPGAIITNVLPDHLDRYSSLAAYARAKANILRFQTKKDWVVLNYDDPVIRRLGRRVPGRRFWYSLKRRITPGTSFNNSSGRAVFRGVIGRSIELFRQSDVRLLGNHNLANALAAATAAHLVGVPPRQIRRAVQDFSGLHSRLELVAVRRGIAYYNDTTATAPVATQAALEVLSNRPLTLIAGGTDKNLPYRWLAYDIARRVLHLVLLPGTATTKLVRLLPKGFRYQYARSMAGAVRRATALTPAGGVVVLSPGAASFGLFVNEWDRGERFVEAVKRLS